MKKLKKLSYLTVLILSSFSIQAYAQFTDPIVINNQVYVASDVMAADIDNDGDLDVFAAAALDDGVVWYENLGNGEFDPQNQIQGTSGDGFYSFKLEDIDQDGLLDIITCGTWSSAIRWHKNLGDGNFGLPIPIAQYSAKDIAVVDMDGDQDLDVVGYTFNNWIAWNENDGTGDFGQEQEIFDEIGTMNQMKLVDFDEDGDYDILYLGDDDNSDLGAVLIENLGGNAFADPQTIYTDINDPLSIDYLDMDNDDDLDVIIGYESNCGWVENLGDGTFGEDFNLLSSNGASQLVLSDIDGDSDVDMITGIESEIYILENLGNQNFSESTLFKDHEDDLSALACHDLTGDGINEILSASEFYDRVSWHEVSENFESITHILASSIKYSTEVQIADLDNDNDFDIVVGSTSDYLHVYTNNGSAGFSQEENIRTTSTLDQSSDVRADLIRSADVDMDGDEDLIVASNTDRNIVWHPVLENGVLGEKEIIHQFDGLISFKDMVIEDFDIDGDLDIVFLEGQGFGEMIWLEHIEPGLFANPEDFQLTFDPTDVGALDYDDDGLLDLVYSGDGDNAQVGWCRNLGNGEWDAQTNLYEQSGNASAPRFIEFNDIDGDGALDLLTTSQQDNSLVWLENTGSSEYTIEHLVNAEPRVYNAWLTDLDNDNDLDILAYQEYYVFPIDEWPQIVWYQNDGAGNYSSEIILLESFFNIANPWDVVYEDLDQDGDRDLILAENYSTGEVFVMKNLLFGETVSRGKVFLDENQNGTLDEDEPGLSGIQVYSEPEGQYSFTYPNGNYVLGLNTSNDTSSLYEISVPEFANWNLTTNPASYTVELDSNSTSVDSLNFGFYPGNPVTAVQPLLTGGFPRCNSLVKYWVSLSNIGSTMPSGVVVLEIPPQASLSSTSFTPDSIVGQSIFWTFADLEYFSTSTFEVEVEFPGFEFIGETLSSTLNISESDDDGNLSFLGSDSLDQVLVCAYDPNDKLVFPVGVGEEGYISLDQELDYTIRFQNTGNDTAFTVTIEDQLDEDLDLSTFELLSSSHEVQTTIEQTGETTFLFENIMLPDSNVDFLGSQGFVRYSIKPKSDLNPNTGIENFAEIYFDFNPPIITNTTLNNIECFGTPLPEILFQTPYLYINPQGNYTYQWYLDGVSIEGATTDSIIPIEDGIYTIEITDQFNCSYVSESYLYNPLNTPKITSNDFHLYPNPTRDRAILISDLLNQNYSIRVYNVLGKEVFTVAKPNSDRIELSKEKLGKGVFIITLVHQSTHQRLAVGKLIIQ